MNEKCLCKKTMKREKGITLIALVVTIVVLLILAGVSLSMLTGENGTITQSQVAKEKTDEAGAKEKIRVEVAGSYGTYGIDIDKLNENLGHIEGLTYKGASISDTNKIEKLPVTVKLNEVALIINKDGSTLESVAGIKFETETTLEIERTPVTIPGKFTVSGLIEECLVEDGLVIYLVPDGKTVDWNNPTDVEYAQKNYDQFVWVPVKNAILDLSSNTTALSSEANIKSAVRAEISAGRYPMAIKKADRNYFGVLYQFSLDSSTNTVKVEPYSSWTPLTTSSRREPAYLTDDDKADASSYNTVGITESLLQTEFNTMVEKVNSNKGFWVGRYETCNMNGGSSDTDNSNDSTQQIKTIKGTTTGIRNVTWYRMYAQQKNYSKLALGSTTTSTSSMIWGSQWDQIMIWMKGEKNTVNTANGEYYVINAVGMGNFGVDETGATKTTKGPEQTGNSENYKVKNIYDLAGNVLDWTLEANSTGSRVFRRRRLQ